MTGSSPDLLAAWLSAHVRPALSERGFTNTASTFHKRSPAGWGVVNFQKSQFGSRVGTRFTINLAVSLDRLAIARGQDPTKKPPEYRCPWRCRFAAATGQPIDRWWDLDQASDLATLTAEILPLLVERGLPILEERMTDAGFIAALTARPRIGHTAYFTDQEIVALLLG